MFQDSTNVDSKAGHNLRKRGISLKRHLKDFVVEVPACKRSRTETAVGMKDEKSISSSPSNSAEQQRDTADSFFLPNDSSFDDEVDSCSLYKDLLGALGHRWYLMTDLLVLTKQQSNILSRL